MTLNNAGPPQEATRVTDWLRPQRILAGPGRVIGTLAVLTIIAYHVAWAASDRPYLSSGLLALGIALATLLALLLLARIKGLVTVRGSVYYFLSLAGAGGVILGLTMIIDGPATGLGVDRTGLIGTITLIAGVFTLAAGMFLRPASTALKRQINQDFATQKVVIADGDAIIRRSRGDFGAGRVERLVDACKAHTKSDDLHYVAYYVDGRCVFYLDVFDHDQVNERFFSEATPEQRRTEYLRMALHLDEWLPDVNHNFDAIDSGILIRVVLDVERGALYYYRVDARRFLIGVTLDQSTVQKADTVMTKLTREMQVLLGHRKNPDFDE